MSIVVTHRRAQAVRTLAAGAVLALGTACKTYSESLVPFSEAWDAGRFAQANVELDELIADESDVDADVVTGSHGADESISLDETDACALLLEKGMANLVDGRPEAAVRVWRRCRDKLDERFKNNAIDFFATAITDDTEIAYAGADYEHIMVRAMLALADLIARGPSGEALPYTLQIKEKQEEIIGSNFGEREGYRPREQYKRVAIGAYLEGVIREAENNVSEAQKVYARGLEYAGSSALLEAAVKRTEAGVARSSEGTGLVHVFYLAGRGPKLIESTAPATDVAQSIVATGALVSGGSVGPLYQKQIPVPAVWIRDTSVPPLSISVAGATLATSEVLLDVNQVALQQLQVNLPMIVARAVVRRVTKGVGSHAVGAAAAEQDRGLGQLVEILANIFSTAFERADTRNWSTLPAQIQVARFELPTGEHVLAFDATLPNASVVVDPARDTFIVIVRPNLNGPGAVLVDAYSKVERSASTPGVPAGSAQ